MTGYTPNKMLPFPDDMNAPANVPADIEALAQATDSVLVDQDTVVSNAAPPGTVVMFASSTAPDGWHLCNGTAHGSSALQAILGSPNTPNLQDLFIVGAGGSYAVGDKDGLNSVTLTAAQSGVPSHTHGVSGTAAGVGNHNHGAGYEANFRASDGPRNETPNEDFYEIGQTGSNLDRTIPPSGAHSHSVSGTAAGNTAANATQAHENRPPFYALTYIIRK